MTAHMYISPDDHDHSHDQWGGTCSVCDGGLAICKVCGLSEGALTTECPGSFVDMDKSHMIYNGVLDFKDGKWVEGTSLHSPKSTVPPVMRLADVLSEISLMNESQKKEWIDGMSDEQRDVLLRDLSEFTQEMIAAMLPAMQEINEAAQAVKAVVENWIVTITPYFSEFAKGVAAALEVKKEMDEASNARDEVSK